MSASVVNKTFVISLLVANDLPEPGEPNTKAF